MVKINLKKLMATGAIIAVLGASALAAPTIMFEIEKAQAKQDPAIVSYQVVTLALYSSGLSLPDEPSDDIQIYCDFEKGLEYTGWLDKESKIVDGSHLAEELTERNIVYAIIDDEYYTENGTNLIQVTAQKTYPATKVEREDGTYFYMATYGGNLEGDKATITETLYILESEEMTLPSGYTLVSIDDIIPTSPYSALAGKTLYSEGKEEGVTLK